MKVHPLFLVAAVLLCRSASAAPIEELKARSDIPFEGSARAEAGAVAAGSLSRRVDALASSAKALKPHPGPAVPARACGKGDSGKWKHRLKTAALFAGAEAGLLALLVAGVALQVANPALAVVLGLGLGLYAGVNYVQGVQNALPVLWNKKFDSALLLGMSLMMGAMEPPIMFAAAGGFAAYQIYKHAPGWIRKLKGK